jgi:hypothetical protein
MKPHPSLFSQQSKICNHQSSLPPVRFSFRIQITNRANFVSPFLPSFVLLCDLCLHCATGTRVVKVLTTHSKWYIVEVIINLQSSIYNLQSQILNSPFPIIPPRCKMIPVQTIKNLEAFCE